MRTRTLGGAIMLYRFPEQIFIDTAEDLIRQVKGADFFCPSGLLHQSLPFAFPFKAPQRFAASPSHSARAFRRSLHAHPALHRHSLLMA